MLDILDTAHVKLLIKPISLFGAFHWPSIFFLQFYSSTFLLFLHIRSFRYWSRIVPNIRFFFKMTPLVASNSGCILLIGAINYTYTYFNTFTLTLSVRASLFSMWDANSAKCLIKRLQHVPFAKLDTSIPILANSSVLIEVWRTFTEFAQ